ncbi:MAG: hypothetical protein CV045_10615 [Cyanobacteria bacterium M5B4]|nr:MAG: hypothetical protein CV045_10615 [Cyanobacteria bacterium M5B4]
MLIWSDIKENTIDDKMYSLLRNGCYRSEEKIFISEGSGNNLPFYVFGQKIISSTDNFFIKPQWSELFRRCLFIRMYHFNELDKNYISEFNKRDLLDIYNIDYRHIAHEYNQFWDSDRILRVKSLYNSKLKLAKTIKDNYAIPELALSISLDLIIQGLAADLYDNQDDAFSTWSNFWQLSSEELGTTQKPILLHIIDTIIEEKIAEFEAQKQQFIKYNRLDLIPDTITISPSTIKQRIDDAKSDGLIEIIKTSEVKEIMLSKGFDLVSHNKKFCYSKKAD